MVGLLAARVAHGQALAQQPTPTTTPRGTMAGPMGSGAIPLIRIIPVWPPAGEDSYPAGTAIFGEEITFPGGSGPTKIWLELRLSGWGTAGLKSYEVKVKRAVGSGCPKPPCPCKAYPYQPPCPAPPGECPLKECLGTQCAPAVIDESRTDRVFREMPFSSEVDYSHPKLFIFRAQVTNSGDSQDDEGDAYYGGGMVYYSLDYCPDLTEFTIEVDVEDGGSFNLGDGNAVTPRFKPATIRMLPTPPDEGLPGNDWWYVVIVSLVFGFVIGAILLRGHKPPGSPGSPGSPVGIRPR